MNKLQWIEHEKYGWYYLKRYPFFNSYIKRRQIDKRTYYEYGNNTYHTLEQAKIDVVSKLRKACKEVLNTPEKGISILISNNHLYNSSIQITVSEYRKTIEINGSHHHCSRNITRKASQYTIDTVVRYAVKILIRHCNRFLTQSL